MTKLFCEICKVEVVSATQHLLASLHGWQRKYYDEHDKVVFWRLVAWGMTCVCFIIAIIK